ncbi:MAG: flagellar hook capping FlgD N-terminal domain-containing protein [Eubacterium sp.]
MATSLDGIVTGLDDLSLNKNRVNESQTSERAVGGNLGKDEFLQLLVCQMKNQDPLEPEKDTEFIAQLAQFSALEQMQNLNETTVNSQAFGLVGKAVVINTKSTNGNITEVQGVVDYITMKNGSAQLSVNGQLYSMDDLVEVKQSYADVVKYLPTVEQTEAVFDKSNKSMLDINIDLGSGNYAASSVAVMVNGEYIKSDYLSFENGVLSIAPAAFSELKDGSYKLSLYFDDPYNTAITDKVSVKVIESGISTEGNDTKTE